MQYRTSVVFMRTMSEALSFCRFGNKGEKDEQGEE